MAFRLWVLQRVRRSSLGRSHAAEMPTAAGSRTVMPEAGDITGTCQWDLAGPSAGGWTHHAHHTWVNGHVRNEKLNFQIETWREQDVPGYRRLPDAGMALAGAVPPSQRWLGLQLVGQQLCLGSSPCWPSERRGLED